MSKTIPAHNFCNSVFDGTHDTPKPCENGHPLILSKNIQRNSINLQDTYNISEEDYNAINARSKVSQWDILFSMIGTVGSVYLEKSKDIPYAIKNMGVFSTKDELKAKWLYYYLQTNEAKSIISNYLNGAVQKFLPLGFLREFPVREMPRNAKEIISVLENIDSKIDNNNAIAAELEGMAKDLYDYWFVQFDFPDENGKPYKSSGGKMVWNEELKREIPEGWEVDRLGKHIISSRGISYNSANLEGDGVPMINLASFGVDSNYKPAGIKTYNGQYDADKILHPFDLIMCNTQQTAIDPTKDIIGKAMLVPDIFDGDVVSSHHVTTITPYVDELKYYLYGTCKTTWFHKYIVGFASGTNILGLDFKGFEDYLMPLPPMRLLKKFATAMKNIESEKNLIITENAELASLRDFLLPMLMNGQVKVKGA